MMKILFRLVNIYLQTIMVVPDVFLVNAQHGQQHVEKVT